MSVSTYLSGLTVNLFHADGTITDEVHVVGADTIGIYGTFGEDKPVRAFFPWSTLLYAEVVS